MKITVTQKDILSLTAVSALIIMWNIWSGSLLSWDEAFYGAVSKEMFRTGDWINMYWAGMPWSDKPPLYMWMTTVFYNIFGINEFSVRLFSSLCGTGLIAAVYLLAKELYSRRAALASSLVLLTTWHFLWSSKVGMLDSALSFFITVSLLLFQLALKNRKLLLLVPFTFAIAFLTKGPGAMIIPIIIIPYAILSGNMKRLLDPYILIGTALSIMILVWWHLAVFSSYGEDFVRSYFVQHLVRRTTTAIEGHTGDIFTYIGTIPNKGRPWSMAGLLLIPVLLFRILKYREKQHLLPVLWACAVIGIFSAVQTKIHWYIIPVYPALALMTGWALDKILKKHTLAVISILAVCSLAYLSVDKEIFNLDYSPNIKETYLKVISDVPDGSELFLYDISDPGLQFYLGWKGQNLRHLNNLEGLMKSDDSLIFMSKSNLGRLGSQKYKVVSEYPDHILIGPEK